MTEQYTVVLQALHLLVPASLHPGLAQVSMTTKNDLELFDQFSPSSERQKWTLFYANSPNIRYLIALFLVLQATKRKPSDVPPEISISVPCVIFQGGSLLITRN